MTATLDELVTQVGAALERDERVDLHHYPIDVVAEDDRIALLGRVENIAAKKVAAQRAREVAGDTAVEDLLRVVPAQPMESGALRDEVARALYEEPVFRDYGIQAAREGRWHTLREPLEGGRVIRVSVHDGVVTLEGPLESLTHRRLAEVLAWWAQGTERVINHLRVVPPERENEGELIDAVRMVLEKDPLVHASQLSVDADGESVTLRGYLPSEEERTLAVLDAWYVPGVRQVNDCIEVAG